MGHVRIVVYTCNDIQVSIIFTEASLSKKKNTEANNNGFTLLLTSYHPTVNVSGLNLSPLRSLQYTLSEAVVYNTQTIEGLAYQHF